MALQLEPGGIDLAEGRWRGAIIEEKRTAKISCPKCGGIMHLASFEIRHDGFVFPQVICPYSCGFKDYVKLRAWDKPA